MGNFDNHPGHQRILCLTLKGCFFAGPLSLDVDTASRIFLGPHELEILRVVAWSCKRYSDIQECELYIYILYIIDVGLHCFMICPAVIIYVFHQFRHCHG